MGRDRTIEVPGESENELPDNEETKIDGEDDAIDYIISLITQLTEDEQKKLYSKIGVTTKNKAAAIVRSEEPNMTGIKKTLTDKGWLVE